MKTPPAILQLNRSTRGEVHAAVLTIEQRSERSERMVLRLGLNLSRGKPSQGFDHQRRARFGHPIKQIRGRLFLTDFDCLLLQNWPGVESLFKQHGGVAGEGVAVRNGPLDWCSAAVFWQQRPVQVDAAKPRKCQHPRRNDAAISYNYNRIGLDGFKLGAKLGVRAYFFRLRDGQV